MQKLLKCFNLAIEMLFISGTNAACSPTGSRDKFQSRNRDAFHFRAAVSEPDNAALNEFQSRNRDAFHFRAAGCGVRGHVFQFQSRNRDAFHFRLPRCKRPLVLYGVSISQSRCFSFQATTAHGTSSPKTIVSISQSRCFSFQGNDADDDAGWLTECFNLAIEMLFISGHRFPGCP